MPRTEPITQDEFLMMRAENLPDALSEKALQRVSTGRVRYALSQLAQNNVERVQEWLDAVAKVNGPKAALELFLKLLEYSVPKLTRTEIKIEDSAGNTAVALLSMEDLQDLIRKGVELEQRTFNSEVVEND